MASDETEVLNPELIHALRYPARPLARPDGGFIAHICLAMCGKCGFDYTMQPQPLTAILIMVKEGWYLSPEFGWVCRRCRSAMELASSKD